MERDFTYIDDVVEAITKCCSKPATVSELFDIKSNPAISSAPFRIFNVGNSEPVKLLRFIEILESVLGIKAIKITCQCNQATLKQQLQIQNY